LQQTYKFKLSLKKTFLSMDKAYFSKYPKNLTPTLLQNTPLEETYEISYNESNINFFRQLLKRIVSEL